MSQIIYRHETNAREEWIEVNDDETVTYHIENSGWNLKAGMGEREIKFTMKEAKTKWPHHAEAFKKVLATIRASQSK